MRVCDNRTADRRPWIDEAIGCIAVQAFVSNSKECGFHTVSYDRVTRSFHAHSKSGEGQPRAMLRDWPPLVSSDERLLRIQHLLDLIAHVLQMRARHAIAGATNR